ncbi:MAG: diguanylate cyclase domain-containing protein [Actinomycetota bacterium]
MTSEQRFKAIVEGVGAIVWEVDPDDLRFTFVSGAAEEMLGYERDAWLQPGFWESILHDDDREHALGTCRAAIISGEGHTLEYRVRAKDGRVVWIRDVVTVEEPGSGGIPIVRGIMVDVSDRRTEEAELRSSENRYRILTDLGSDYSYCVSLSESRTHLEWATDGFTRVTGYTPEEVEALGGPETIIHPDDEVQVQKAIEDLFAHGRGSTDLRLIRKDGRVVWLSVHYRVVPEEGTTLIYGAARDITERKELEESLRASEERFREVAVVDSLTGVRNRRGFDTVAEHELAVATRNHEMLLLLFVDVDGLKVVNDTYGHGEGDSLLRNAATLLSTTFRSSDLLARIGGDEFCVLFRAPEESSDDLTGRLRDAVAAHNSRASKPYLLRLSLGTATFDPDDPCTLEELKNAADHAMYRERRRHNRPDG